TESVQANFEANFGHMLVDVLRLLCHELEIAESDSKQDLVNVWLVRGASAPMFGSVGSLLFEPVVGSTSSIGDVRPGEKRFL
ncbi:6249_t:CDS:2, partial [Cetraspora pellucida]